MKRYKLKRDLPTFNVGDVFYLSDAGNLLRESDNVPAYSWTTLDNFPNILTDWFEEIKEPLIKDEKIRKAIRAWAEANEVGVVLYKEDNYRFYADDTEVGSMIEFEDMPEYIGLRHEHRYTIDELCGEEEE